MLGNFGCDFPKFAFTLAEVLITLGVIGVVAVLTIMPIVQKHNERSTVVKVKQMYSVIANAVNMWQTEESCENNVADCLKNYPLYNCALAFGGIEKHLEILERRYQYQDVNKINWLPVESYNFDGTWASVSFKGVNKVSPHSNYTCHYLFKNGTTMTVQFDTFKDSMFSYIDINGKTKPNRVGIDVFPIGIGSHGSKSKTVNPYHVEDSDSSNGLCAYRNGNECSVDDGKSPTAYVLVHEKLPKLK